MLAHVVHYFCCMLLYYCKTNANVQNILYYANKRNVLRMLQYNMYTHGIVLIIYLKFYSNLSPGKTIEQSWIQHPTLLDVNVEIVAKHYPTLLDETSYRGCKLALTRERKALVAFMVLEMLEVLLRYRLHLQPPHYLFLLEQGYKSFSLLEPPLLGISSY